MSYEDRPDHNWESSDSIGVGAWTINNEFRQHPMMRLFDETAVDRLSFYVMSELDARRKKNGGYLNYSQAAYAAQKIIEDSPYGVFGHPVASTVAACVQKALYNQTLKELNAKS